MKKSVDGRSEAVEKALKLLGAAKTHYLATNGSHGHPNLRAMAPLKIDGVKSVWFATYEGSSKVQELLKDGNAVIYAEASRDATECRLWGNIEVLSDDASKKYVWSEELRDHFPDGADSPEMRVLRFDVSNGIYIDKNREIFEFKN